MMLNRVVGEANTTIDIIKYVVIVLNFLILVSPSVLRVSVEFEFSMY